MALPFELLDCIGFWASHRADSLALSSTDRAFSYRDLQTILNSLSLSLHSVDRGRVAILASAKLATAMGVLGILHSGRSAVVLNPFLPPEMLKACLEDAQASSILVASENEGGWKAVTDRYASMGALPHIVFASIGGRSMPTMRPRPIPAANTEWAVLYSSGSTGAPKGIERDFESMHTEFIGWCLELGLGTSSRFYIGRPVFYTGGLVLTMATLLAGGSAVLNELPGETADALVHDIRESALADSFDWAFLVPDQVRQLLHCEDTPQLKGRVRGVLVMGAFISGREKQALAARLSCTVRESWGTSESLGTITDDAMLHECPDSIGRPFLGDSMCVVDDNGNECAVGTIGRLAGGELAGFTCYTARPEDTANVKRHGLIISEDLGRRDSQGRFFIEGRVQERVLIDGRQVFLPRLEETLRAHGVQGAFCLTHRIVGDVAEIGMLFETGIMTASNIREHVERIETHVAVVAISEVPNLPRTASGKVDRLGAANLLWPKA